MVFIKAIGVKGPCVPHGCVTPIINTDPSIEDAGQNFKQENDDQLGICEPGMGKKLHFGYQPGKQQKIADKEKVFHTTGFARNNSYN